jgi:hypothetical protein
LQRTYGNQALILQDDFDTLNWPTSIL